jgi:hypothetical protein
MTLIRKLFGSPVPRSTRKTRLGVQCLEGREVPAGVVTASLSPTGLLTLTGDDAANSVSVTVTPTVVILSPDPSTAIDVLGTAAPAAPGISIGLGGTVTSLRATLNGGDDTLAIPPVADLTLPGSVTIDLGDGNNQLALGTSGKIDLGSLTVRAGDGSDNITLSGGGGTGSRVVGAATIALGDGDSTVNVSAIDFPGPAGVRLTAGEGDDHMDLESIHAAGPLAVAAGNGLLALKVGLSTTGPVSVTGTQEQFELTQTTVTGGLTVRGQTGTLPEPIAVDATLSAATVSGPVHLTGTARGAAVLATVIGDFTVGGLTLRSAGPSVLDVQPGVKLSTAGDVRVTGFSGAALELQQAELDARNLTVSSSDLEANFVQTRGAAVNRSQLNLTGALTVRSPSQAAVEITDGTAAVGGNLTVAGSGVSASLVASGKSLSVGGNLTVTAPTGFNSNIDLQATEVHGNLTMTGGPGNDRLTTDLATRFDRDVTLTLGGGLNAAVVQGSVGRNLTITTGAGTDLIDLVRLQVAGATRIVTGGGADSLSINDGVIFSGTFFTDLGAGDDSIIVAAGTAATSPVTFQKTATIRGGTGNDSLTLGKSIDSGGSTGTVAVFQAGGTVDGGTGLNLFDGLTPDQSPSQFTGLSAGNFLHWTDPNP